MSDDADTTMNKSVQTKGTIHEKRHYKNIY